MKHSQTTFNYFFAEGKISFLLDGFAGSSGKGLLSSNIVKNSTNCNFAISTNGQNASHYYEEKFPDGSEKIILFKVLPTSSVYHKKLDAVYVCQGAAFEPKRLLEEIELTGIPRHKVRIHYKAGIISQQDRDFESGVCDYEGNINKERQKGTVTSGTTASGAGAVRAKKCMRNPDQKIYAYEYPELQEFLCDTEREIMYRLDSGQSGLFEIAQGFALSYGLSYSKRNTTARNCSITAAIDDAMIAPFYIGNVFINLRTHPIKINNMKWVLKGDVPYYVTAELSLAEAKARFEERLFNFVDNGIVITVITKKDIFLTGFDLEKYPEIPYEVVDSYSGDWYRNGWEKPETQEELTWEQVEEQYGDKINKKAIYTSLTLMPRRVGSFSTELLEDSIRYNMPPSGYKVYLSLNFCNWLDKEIEGKTEVQDITEKVENWINKNIDSVVLNFKGSVKLAILGTGKWVDEFIQV